MKTILVTGATGFLGRHLVRHLRAASPEDTLRLLCWGDSPWENESGIEVVQGDITDPAAVDAVSAGVEEIYHLAGFVSRNPRDAEKLHAVHVQGSRNMCEAALRHGAKKMVAVSSSGTIAVSRDAVAHNEESGYKDAISGRWPYYASKIRAEREVLRYFAERQLPVVVVNPALILGPGDVFGSSTGDVRLFIEGRIPSIPPGGACFVDARDCAAGLIAAMRRGLPGERYLLGGVNWTFKELAGHIAGLSGRRPPFLKLPTPLALVGARVMRKLLPLVGRQFPLDDASIEMSGHFWYCDSSKAAAELGYVFRDPLETLRDTVADLRARR